MNKIKFILEQRHTDFNGHVSEAGYLTIANEAIWRVFNSIGLNEIFLDEKIGPIIFDTHMHFKVESMEIIAQRDASPIDTSGLITLSRIGLPYLTSPITR